MHINRRSPQAKSHHDLVEPTTEGELTRRFLFPPAPFPLMTAVLNPVVQARMHLYLHRRTNGALKTRV